MTKKKLNQLAGRFWITSNGKNVAGQGRIELLKRIENTGSISAAAKEMAMSYKAAWDSVNIMNKLSPHPLVERSSRGKQGGGTSLTSHGKDFIKLYEKYSDAFEKFLTFIEEHPEQIDMIGKSTMKTSADNVFCGEIIKIETGSVNDLVYINTESGQQIIASITSDSVKNMGLAEGGHACALITASRLIVIETEENGNNIMASARNKFYGKVSSVTKGAVNSEISLDIKGKHKLKIVITNDSAESLQLTFGKTICAFCKASDVILIA